MSEKTTEVKQEAETAKKVETKSRGYIWVIVIAVILLIILGIFFYLTIAGTSGVTVSGTLIALYILAILLLIIGIIMGFYS